MDHKILFVIDNLEFGGGERGFLQIIEHLDKKSFKVCVASNPDSEFGKKINKMGVPLFPLRMTSKYNVFTVVKLSHIINEEKIDLVHSQGARADFFARVAVKFCRRPYLVTTIQMPVEGFNVSIYRRIVYRYFDCIFGKYVDRFIVVSDNLKTFLSKTRQVPEKKIAKVYNGIEVESFCPNLKTMEDEKLKKSFGIKKDTITVGAIGRLCWQKGFEYFLKSIPAILSKNNKVKFLIVGAGPLQEQLENLAKYLMIDKRVIFTGFRDDIRSILYIIDLLVVPSIREGFPMIILEAMAMAKPIAAANLPGISEQLENGITGRLFEPRNHEEISNVLMDLIADKEKRTMLGEMARQAAIERFSIERMVWQVEQVYQELLT
jgi:glycosyltransferase involved in cell wall biosynthesis